MRHTLSWRRPMVALAISLVTSSLGAQAAPAGPGRILEGTLSFDGHSTLGDFTGITHTVSGEFLGGAPLTDLCGWVEAPVASLRTGKGKRDTDLNTSMESDRFPVIRYGLHGMSVEQQSGDTAMVVLHGSFMIHGVTRAADLPARIVLGADRATVVASAPLNLKDYEIGGLSKMLGVLKMHEEIVVHVDLLFGIGASPSGIASDGERREVYGAC